MAPVSDSLKNNVSRALPPDVAGVLRVIISDVGIPGQLFGKPFLHCTLDEAQSEFFARVAGEAVLDSRHYGINIPTLETATRSGKYAIQTILESEGSDLRIVPFDRPLHARKFKLAR